MSKTTMKQVTEAAKAADMAISEALEAVEPAYRRALETAQARLADMERRADQGAEREKLIAILDDAVAQYGMDATTASNVVQQYIAGVAARKNITQTQAQSGDYLLASLRGNTWDWPEEQRKKSLVALMMAAGGHADPGLAVITRDHLDAVSIKDLAVHAALLAPAAVDKAQGEIEKLRREENEARDMLAAVEQAAPRLDTIFDYTNEGAA